MPASFWNEPAMHSVQVASPVVAVIVPGAQAAAAVEPVEQNEPSGQVVHSLAAVRPAVFEKDPAGHGSSAAAPALQ